MEKTKILNEVIVLNNKTKKILEQLGMIVEEFDEKSITAIDNILYNIAQTDKRLSFIIEELSKL